MKVLITTDWYRPAVNGVVTSVRNLAEGLKLDAFLAPLPPAERSALRAKLGLGADDLALTFVGRLAKEKNVSELLAFLPAFLPAAPRNVKLLLVGDGPCRHELEAQARERGLTDRVLFAGMAAPERVADCYKAGDVFVSASRSETQGLTYLEAMASGLPLRCREDDCLKGVLSPGENGFSYTTEAGFSAAVRALQSAALRRRLGTAAQALADARFSEAGFARAALAVYESCLAGAMGARAA